MIHRVNMALLISIFALIGLTAWKQLIGSQLPVGRYVELKNADDRTYHTVLDTATGTIHSIVSTPESAKSRIGAGSIIVHIDLSKASAEVESITSSTGPKLWKEVQERDKKQK